MSSTSFPAAVPHAHRSPLGDMARALAASLVRPPDHAWRAHMTAMLEPLRAAFADHRSATEGDRGIYANVVVDAPRLARTVDGLVAEHSELDSAMASLARAAARTDLDATALRTRALKVLDALHRHREHDANLVHEAYTTDIGGE